jgi:hypothetical protein
MKYPFEEPEICVVHLSERDIITTSCTQKTFCPPDNRSNAAVFDLGDNLVDNLVDQ